MISLNVANVMKEVIGRKGFSEREIEDFRERSQESLKQLLERKWPELSFLDLPEQNTRKIKEISLKIRDASDYFLLLGIGGSALGPRAILEALSPFHNFKKSPKIFIYDNVDPLTLDNILSIVDLRKTTVNVITKSGSTAETIASFMVLWEEMEKVHGKEVAERFVITTDPEKGNLREIVRKFSIDSLPINQGIGGRFSVLSPVGLLLSEVIGIDAEALLSGARDIRERCFESDLWKNPALLLSTALYKMGTNKGRTIDILIPYRDSLKYLSEWFSQLWAESLGKQGTGFTPYPSVGATDQHSQLQLWMEGPEDKVVIFIRVEDYGKDIKIPHIFENMEGLNYLSGHSLLELIKAEEESTELALAQAERPNLTISLPVLDTYHLGQLFMFLEIVTALTGFFLGINPFNQPGVEEGKNFTYGMMGKKGYDIKKDEVEAWREKKVCWTI